MSENGEVAVATLEEASVALPEVWDRKGDSVVQFAEELDARWRIAKAIAQSGLTSQKRPEAVLAIMLAAYEIGLPLMQALRGMYYVSGKIALEGHLMDALAIARCGVSKTVVKSTDKECVLTFHRAGWDDMTVTYTIDDAVRAGLVGVKDGKLYKTRDDTWIKHPIEKLYWRCTSKGLKRIAPDFFGGVYSIDELQQIADARVVASSSSLGAELDALDDGKDTDTIDMFEE